MNNSYKKNRLLTLTRFMKVHLPKKYVNKINMSLNIANVYNYNISNIINELKSKFLVFK